MLRSVGLSQREQLEQNERGLAAPGKSPVVGSARGFFGIDMPDRHFQSRPAPSLAPLILAHKSCFVRLRNRTLAAFENERRARSQIIAYEPHDPREALERLSYLFAVIATAGNWLQHDEMEELLTMVRNY